MNALRPPKPPQEIKHIPVINTAQYVLKTLSTTPSYDTTTPFSRVNHKAPSKNQTNPAPSPQTMAHSMEIRKIIG